MHSSGGREGTCPSLSLVRDLCFVDSESNCLCAREDGTTGEEWSFVVSHSLGSFRPLPRKVFSLFWHVNKSQVSDFLSRPVTASPFISDLPLSLCQSSEIIFMKVRRWHERGEGAERRFFFSPSSFCAWRSRRGRRRCDMCVKAGERRERTGDRRREREWRGRTPARQERADKR